MSTDYLAFTNALYGVGKDDCYHNKTIGTRFGELCEEYKWGVPIAIGLTGGLPFAVKPFQHAYQAHQLKAQNPNMSFGERWNQISAQNAQRKASLKYLTDGEGFFSGLANKNRFAAIEELGSKIPAQITNHANLTGKDLIKYQNNKRINLYYKQAKKLIEEAKTQNLKGNALKQQMHKILKAMQQGDVALNNAKANGLIKPTSRWGKLKHGIKKGTGYYKFKGKFLKSPRMASAWRQAAKHAGGKGNLLFLALSGLMEYGNIKSAMECDKQAKQNGQKGGYTNMQLKKSAVKVGASVLGYAAGSAATGAILGSVCPGVGNIVGGVLGFIGGCAVGAVASFFADKTVGERNASDIYADLQNHQAKKESKLLAKKAKTDKNTQDKVLAALVQAVETEQITDQKLIAKLEKELKRRTNGEEIYNNAIASLEQQAAENKGLDVAA